MKVEVSKFLLVKVIPWPLEKSIGSVCSRLLDDDDGELITADPTVLASTELAFFVDTIGTMLDGATLNEELTTEAELETAVPPPHKAPIKFPVAAIAGIAQPVPLVKSKI